MKIVIVCQYFWPDNFLVNEIADELSKRGHIVTVLTGLPDYTTNVVPKEYRFGKNRHESRNNIEIFRVPIIARHTGFFSRVLNYISFFITSSVFAVFHRFEADVIMNYQVASALTGNAGIILKKKLKKPLFFYCLDIWPDQMKVWGIDEHRISFKIMKKYCQYAYGSGDLVGITSRPFRDYLISINKVSPERIVYLQQHSTRMNIEDSNRRCKKQIDLIFAGNIGYQQNVRCLLKAVSCVSTDKRYHVHVYGNGSAFEECKKLANDLNIDRKVTFYGRVSKEELSKIYSQMDAFLLTLCSEKEIGFVANTVPAKFQSYLSAGKPILASIDGGAREIIESINCGLVVGADDYIGFAKIIQEFIENPENYKDCGKNGKRYFDENYEKSIVIDKLETYLAALVDNG